MKKVLIISHDAGGANVLLAWCKSFNNIFDFIYMIDGPAKKIFSEGLGKQIDAYPKSANDFYMVVTSSGWQTDFEWNGVLWAKKNSIPVCTYLDHWVNYKERFIRNNCCVYPDEIWVPDRYAYDIASLIFPNSILIRYMRNRYWVDIKKKVLQIDESDGVIFIHEPIRDDEVDINKIYEHLVEYLISLGIDQLVIRKHPSGEDEFLDKFVRSVSKQLDITFSSNTMEYDIAKNRVIIGYQSSVLPLALICDKHAISFFPVTSRTPYLPHQEIEYI